MEQSTIAPSVETSPIEAPAENAQTEITQTDVKPDTPENPFKGTKHKLKAKGKELEVDYDDLLAKASLYEGAQMTFKEAKEFRQSVEDKLARLSDVERDNFDEIVEMLGVEKALKFASTLNERHSYWEGLSEEQRADILERHEAELAKQELAELKGKEKQQAIAQASKEAYEAINLEIGDALAEARAQGIPLADLPDIGIAIVDEMLLVLEQIEAEERIGKQWSGKAPSAKDVVKKLQGQYEERSASYVKKLNAKQLKSMLTPEQLAELRKEEIDSLYAGATPNRMTSKDGAIRSETNKNSNQSGLIRRSSGDAFKDLDEKYGVHR